MQSFYQNKTFKKAQYVSEKKEKKRAEHYFPAEHHISPVKEYSYRRIQTFTNMWIKARTAERK